MGIFRFRNTRTGREMERTMTIREAEEYIKAHPHIDWLAGAPMIHSGRGLSKPENGFRDVLRDIKRRNRRSKINTFD